MGGGASIVSRAAVVFDLDGTLLDLPVPIEEARAKIASLFRARGFEGSLSPILPAIEEAAAAVAASDDERRELSRRARALLSEAEREAAPRARRRPGADLALRLAERGVPVAVLTDNGRACVDPALRAAGLGRLAERAAAIVTRDEAARPKPHPDGLLAAVRALPPVERLFVVGDSERDVRAARAAARELRAPELFAIGVLGGRSGRPELEAAGADRVLETLDELGWEEILEASKRPLPGPPPEGGRVGWGERLKSTLTMKRSVSCTVFAYNEEGTVAEAVRDVHAALSGLGREFEVLLVDDGSTDRTAEIGLELEERYPEVHLLRHGRNLGPGSAILTGIRNSRNEVICFHAADQQLDFHEVASFIPLLDEHDIVIGRRSGRPDYTRMRKLSSAVYIRLAQWLFDLGGYDDFNFLYLYRRELFEDMPIESDGVFLCTEIFVRARDQGARVALVEARCLPRREGVSRVYRPGVIAKTLGEMGRFWWRRRRGGRAGPPAPRDR